MGQAVITYDKVVVSPFKLVELVELKIEKKINHHTKLYFTGIVPEEQKDEYIKSAMCDTPVEIKLVGDDSKPVFKGLVQNVEIKAIRGVHYIMVEAVSCTYSLDVKIKSRSFQDKGMSYSDLVKKVISDTSGADYMDEASKGKTIEKFTMQYQETDWEFIKRMASRFNAGLVPDSVSDKPKFYFGVHEGASKKLEEYHYNVRKKISDFKSSSQNSIKGIDENDFIYYEVESKEILDIGCKVDFMGKSLYVCEILTQFKDSILTHMYTLTPKKGLSQNTIYNHKIIGLTVEGEVLAVEKDNVKVHLNIDESQSEGSAWWFHYSTGYTSEGNSGWYCMPEKKDHVLVHFPDYKEENGVSIGSVRKDSEGSTNNKVGNPDIKYFRTKNGKELMFSEKEILISAKDGEVFIKLNEDSGIEIYSKKDIKFIGKEDISFSSEKNIVISAKTSISMKCKESSLNMDGTIRMKGKEVKTN